MRHILCFSFSNVRICCLLLVNQTWKVESFTNLNIKHLTDHKKSSLGSLIKATIYYSHCSWCYNWLVVTDSNLTWEEENIPAAWHWDPAGCLRELSSSSPLHREQIHRHITGKHIHATLHKKEAHSEKEKGEREREKACEPLLSLCIRAEARLWLQSVLKSLPGVHSQPWTQEERDGEGETSKVNTTGSYGPAQYICHLEEERKKMKQNAKTWTLFLIDLHQSASDSNVCLRTQMCIHTQKSSTVDFYSFITKRKKSHLLHAWVCKTQGESAQRTERELGSRLHGNKEEAGIRVKTQHGHEQRVCCASASFSATAPEFSIIRWKSDTTTTGCSSCWNKN